MNPLLPHDKQCKENTTKETKNIINGIKFLLVASETRRQVDAKAQLFLDNINYTCTLTLFNIIIRMLKRMLTRPMRRHKSDDCSKHIPVHALFLCTDTNTNDTVRYLYILWFN
jgi:hypothetical protein